MPEAARYTFTAADAVRALGMPEHEALADVHLSLIVAKNGLTTVGRGRTAEEAEAGALSDLDDHMAFFHAELGILTERLQQNIRLEQWGLPMGRTDVNPTQVPALASAPDGFTQARSTDVALEDGLVDPHHVAEAWGALQKEVAAADPPFPAVLLGYTFEVHEDGAGATLTVYA